MCFTTEVDIQDAGKILSENTIVRVDYFPESDVFGGQPAMIRIETGDHVLTATAPHLWERDPVNDAFDSDFDEDYDGYAETPPSVETLVGA